VESSPEPLPAATEPSQVAPPLLGLTPESTSALAAGPALPLGNTMLAGVHSVARPSRVSSGPRGAVSPVGRETTSKRRTEPKLQSSVLPDYPSEAKRAGVEGVVILLLSIDARGLVQSVRVLKGLGHGLDESAVRAAKQTRWQPATLGPNAVQSTRAFNVRFSLQS
jgi:TonB family protein